MCDIVLDRTRRVTVVEGGGLHSRVCTNHITGSPGSRRDTTSRYSMFHSLRCKRKFQKITGISRKPKTLEMPRTSKNMAASTSRRPHKTPSPTLGGVTKRRPKRPIDRQKMRPWLEEKLKSEYLKEQLWWVKEGEVFAVKWTHAARHGYDAKEDASVFKAWAIHTEAFKESEDEPNPNRWKANFRCALHSLLDVQEMTQPGERKGQNAVRTYRLLDPAIVADKKGRKGRKGRKPDSGVDSANVREAQALMDHNAHALASSSSSTATSCLGLSISPIPTPVPDIAGGLPDFQQLMGSTTKFITNQNGGGCVIVNDNKVEEVPRACSPGVLASYIANAGPSAPSRRARTPSGDSGNGSSEEAVEGSPQNLYLNSSFSDCDVKDYIDEGLGLESEDMEQFQAVGTMYTQVQGQWPTEIDVEPFSQPEAVNVITEEMESAAVENESPFSLTALQNLDMEDINLYVGRHTLSWKSADMPISFFSTAQPESPGKYGCGTHRLSC